MSEHTKKTQITVDDVTYNYEDLTPEQQKLFRHCRRPNCSRAKKCRGRSQHHSSVKAVIKRSLH